MTNLPALGSPKEDLDTPLLCVDLDVMEANVQSLVAACRDHGVQWRPHIKCHKSPAIARKLIEAGAIGVTCAKLGEAEVMAAGGVDGLLIANLLVGRRKLERLVRLRRQSDVIVCVDDAVQAEALGRAMSGAGLTLRVLIETDVGMGRVGVLPGEPALQLARRIAGLPGLHLSGIMGYEGHLLRIAEPAEKETRIREALDRLVQTRDLLEDSGVACPIVSCGGTGSFSYSVKHPGITELQAGGGIFMDAFYRHSCQVTQWDYALSVLTTIVSRPAPERAVIDAGRKTMNIEIHPAIVPGRDDIVVQSLSAEHGTLRLAPSAQHLAIGDRLEIIPGYSDLTCVLHDHLYGFRRNKLEVIWPLEARGKLQ